MRSIIGCANFMNFLKELINITIGQNNITLFSNTECIVLIIYSLVFFVLLLENAILPAIFLPGDSLLIVLGILIAKGILNFIITLGILTIAVSLGSWIGYLQGKFLENNKITQRWLSKLPLHFYQKVCFMFDKYGLFILFIGRFIAFLRTILPTVAGIAGFNVFRFHVFNLISAFIWVFMLTVLGFFLARLEQVINIF